MSDLWVALSLVLTDSAFLNHWTASPCVVQSFNHYVKTIFLVITERRSHCVLSVGWDTEWLPDPGQSKARLSLRPKDTIHINPNFVNYKCCDLKHGN